MEKSIKLSANQPQPIKWLKDIWWTNNLWKGEERTDLSACKFHDSFASDLAFFFTVNSDSKSEQIVLFPISNVNFLRGCKVRDPTINPQLLFEPIDFSFAFRFVSRRKT